MHLILYFAKTRYGHEHLKCGLLHRVTNYIITRSPIMLLLLHELA